MSQVNYGRDQAWPQALQTEQVQIRGSFNTGKHRGRGSKPGRKTEKITGTKQAGTLRTSHLMEDLGAVRTFDPLEPRWFCDRSVSFYWTSMEFHAEKVTL